MWSDRAATEWIRTHVPHEAVMLANPQTQDVWSGLYANHQIAAFDLTCGTAFGGSAETCREMIANVLPWFRGEPLADSDIDPICKRYSIRTIFVKDLDPVWHNPQSWIWHRKPVYANAHARVFECGR